MSHVSKPTLVAVNSAAALLLLAMRDLESTTRLLVAAAVVFHDSAGVFPAWP